MPRFSSVYERAKHQRKLWTPTPLRLALWLDAADRSTITITTGVSQWKDKGRNGRHVSQATEARRVTYAGSGLNGRPTLDWGSAVNNKGFQNLSVSNFNPTRYFIVADYDGANPFNEYTGLVAHTPFSAVTDLLITNNYGTLWYAGNYFHNGKPTATSVALPTISQPFVVASNFSQPGNRTALFIGNDRFFTNLTRGWRGKISEVIAIDYVPSVAERNRAVGSLAWKWGIRLNSSHPFVNRPPLIGD